MSTFAEIQKKLVDNKNKREVLLLLRNYLEEDFISVGQTQSKNVLLDETKAPIPGSTFEEVVLDLNQQIADITAEIESINQSSVTPTVVEKKTSKKADKAVNGDGT